MYTQIVKPFKSETFMAFSKLAVMLTQDIAISTKDDYDIIERINLAPESEIILNCVMMYCEHIEQDPKGLAKIAHYQDQFDSELFNSSEEAIAANRRFHIKNCLQSCSGLIKLFDAHGVKLSQLYMDYAGDAGWVSGQKGVTLSDLKAAAKKGAEKSEPKAVEQAPKAVEEQSELELLKQQLAAMQSMIAKLTAAPEPKAAKQEQEPKQEPKAAKKKAQKNNSQMSLI